MALFTAHLCITQQCLMSYCSDESNKHVKGFKNSYFTTSKDKSYTVFKFEFEPVVTNPLTIPSFILVHLHTSFTRLLNHTFLLKFAFYGVSLFSPNLVSTISPSYFATGQSVENFSTLMIKRRCKTTY